MKSNIRILNWADCMGTVWPVLGDLKTAIRRDVLRHVQRDGEDFLVEDRDGHARPLTEEDRILLEIDKETLEEAVIKNGGP